MGVLQYEYGCTLQYGVEYGVEYGCAVGHGVDYGVEYEWGMASVEMDAVGMVWGEGDWSEGDGARRVEISCWSGQILPRQIPPRQIQPRQIPPKQIPPVQTSRARGA